MGRKAKAKAAPVAASASNCDAGVGDTAVAKAKAKPVDRRKRAFPVEPPADQLHPQTKIKSVTDFIKPQPQPRQDCSEQPEPAGQEHTAQRVEALLEAATGTSGQRGLPTPSSSVDADSCFTVRHSTGGPGPLTDEELQREMATCLFVMSLFVCDDIFVCLLVCLFVCLFVCDAWLLNELVDRVVVVLV